MTGQIFVVPDGQVHGRWLLAFPQARVVSSFVAAVEGCRAGATVWSFHQRVDQLREFLIECPKGRCVVLSLKPGRQEGLRAFEAGARGYCHALATPDMLQDVAFVVERGGMWVGEELMSDAVRRIGTLVEPGPKIVGVEELTQRECDVGRSLVNGLSNREIANELAITERTVKAHLATMFEKLQVRDRLQLAIQLGRAGFGNL